MSTDHPLSIKRQCELLEVNRSSFYYIPQQESSYNDELMKLIDKQYFETPFFGVPKMTKYLRSLGYQVNPKRIRRLYRLMDIHAIGPRPNTSKPHKGKGHSIFPYLLRDVEITRPNQAWGMDICYVPVDRGYMYLVAIIDLYSRYIVGWSLSNTMTSERIKACLKEAISKYGEPEIVNTDQGSQFTSPIFTSLFEGISSKLSMDGKGRWVDNVFIERFWRSLKYEKVYVEPSDDGHELYEKIKWYMVFYNTRRPHQTLNYLKPEQLYAQAV